MMKRYLSLVLWLTLACLPSMALAQPGPVGPEFLVNTYTLSRQLNPSAASDATGNFIVIWDSFGQDGDEQGVFGQRYDSSGSRLGGEFRVNTYTTGEQENPAVAADAVGNFVVVWQDGRSRGYGQDGSGDGIRGRRYDSSGTPLGGEFQVNTYVTGDQFLPSVASDATGNFIVVWTSREQDGDRSSGIFGQRYNSAGSRLGPEFQVNPYTIGSQNGVSVASDASGNFVVVWTSDYQDGSMDGVFGQRYDSGGNPLGGEFQVNTYTTGTQDDPSVAADATGNFVVVYGSYQIGSGLDIFGQRYSSDGNPLGMEFQANTYTTFIQAHPVVASDAAGNFVVTWYSFQDGDEDGVFGQSYDNGGYPVGGEFQVNTYTSRRQSLPRVASDAAGNFVVVWWSEEQDGNSEGIFGQRFSSGVSGGCRSTSRNPTSLCPANLP